MAKLSPIGNNAQFIGGVPASGAKLFFYAAGSSTKQTTYTDEAGIVPQTNPIILDSRGEPSQPIWLTEGLSYKVVFTSSTDTDPPVSPIWDIDNVTGINDASLTIDQWINSGVTPLYVSATQFTLSGDQTSAFQVNRRVKLLVTAGTVYGRISVSSYAALTTVTVALDSGVLDSGLSSVQLGLITPNNTSLFLIKNANLDNSYINDLTTVTFDPVSDYVAIADASDSGNKKKTLIPVTGIQGAFKNLSATSSGLNANVTVTADEVMVEDSSNIYKTLRTVSLTIAGTSVGANGIDAGTIAASTWYSVWVIWNGTTTSGLLSLSATAPTLPSGYTFKARVGWIRTDGTANKYPLSFFQNGRNVQYKPAAGSNLTQLPTLATGVQGTVGTTLVATSLTNFLPTTASKITLNAYSPASSSTQVGANAVANIGSGNSINPSAPAGIVISIQGTFVLESNNIYYAGSNASSFSTICGWEDNI